MGGVINIITRPAPEEFTASVSTAFGSRATRIHEVSAGFRGGERGQWGASFNFTHRETEGVRPEWFRTRRGIDYKDSDETMIQLFQGRLEHEFSPESKLTLKPFYSEHIPQIEDRASPTETQDRRIERQGLNAIWEWQPDELSVLNLRGSWFDHTWRDEDERRYFGDYSREMEASYSRLLGRHTLTAGYHYHYLERKDRVADFCVDQTIHSFFLQNEMDLEPLTLVLGARLDDHDVWGTEVNPRASLLYRLTEALRLRASAGTAFRGPDLYALYGSIRRRGLEMRLPAKSFPAGQEISSPWNLIRGFRRLTSTSTFPAGTWAKDIIGRGEMRISFRWTVLLLLTWR